MASSLGPDLRVPEKLLTVLDCHEHRFAHISGMQTSWNELTWLAAAWKPEANSSRTDYINGALFRLNLTYSPLTSLFQFLNVKFIQPHKLETQTVPKFGGGYLIDCALR